jgi:hypothetical protein
VVSKIGISRREFLAVTGAVGGSLMVGGHRGYAVAAGGVSVSIVVDRQDPLTKEAPVQWAVARLAEVLKQRGVAAKPEGDLKVFVGQSGADADRMLVKEGVTLVPAAGGIQVVSRDVRGMVYGVTELADRMQYANDIRVALAQKNRLDEKPASPIRGMFRMFASETEDKRWFYERDTWQRYFDYLVAQRFNRFNLSFGLTYDFSRNLTDVYTFFAYPFFVDVPGYSVKAIARNGDPLSEEEQRKNLDTLAFISDQAALRGLDFQLGLWTHSYAWTNSPSATYVIQGLSAETQAPYSRDAMRMMLAACPGITGVTLRTHGESGVPEGSYDLWKIIMSGITGLKNADGAPRTVELDLHGKTMTQEMIDTAFTTGMPVTISCKFWAEHMGLPYVQASIREQEMPKASDASGLMALSIGTRSFLRYGVGDLLRQDRKYKLIHRVWPGSQRLLVWGDPVYAAEMGKAATFAGMDGIEFFEPLSFRGRAGSSLNAPSAPDRCGYSDPSLRVTAEEGGEMFKYAYTLRVLGRLAYDPAAPAESWERAMPSQELGRALANASRILPLITTAHLPCAACGLYWPETYLNQSLYDERRNPYSEAPSPRIFANVTALDPQMFASIAEFADTFVANQPLPKINPLHVANQLLQWGNSAEDAVSKWRDALGAGQRPEQASPTERRLVIDVSIAAELGRFFANKLVAATCLAIFDRTGYEPAFDAAREYYGKAVARWEQLTELSSVYVHDLTYGRDRQVRGNWADRLRDLKADVDNLAGNDAIPRVEDFSKEAVDKLIANPWWMVQKLESLQHESPGNFKPGTAIRLFLQGAGDYAGRLVYRHVHQGERYQTAPLHKSDACLSGEIPADYTNSAFPLAYFFELTNEKNAFIYPGFAPDFVGQPYYVIAQSI